LFLTVISVLTFNVVNAQDITPGTNIGDLGLVSFNYQGTTVIYTTVRLGDGSIWLQQNLGSSQVATSSTDRAAWGHYFQWGRWDDGHQVAIPNEANNGWSAGTSPNHNGLPEPNNPTGFGSGVAEFYYSSSNNYWRTPVDATVNGTTYLDVTESNGCDPCRAIGEGWTLPTKVDWEAIKDNVSGILGVTAGAITNAATGYESILKLTTPGIRANNNGGRAQLSSGFYWSGTGDPNPAASDDGRAFNFNIGASASAVSGMRRGYGISVRCVYKNTSAVSTAQASENQIFGRFENNRLIVNNLLDTDKGSTLSIFDVHGKLLFNKVIAETPQTTFDVNVEQGVYLMNVGGNRNFTTKIVK